MQKDEKYVVQVQTSNFNLQKLQRETAHTKFLTLVQVLCDGAGFYRLPGLLHGRKEHGHTLATPGGHPPRQDTARK